MGVSREVLGPSQVLVSIPASLFFSTHCPSRLLKVPRGKKTRAQVCGGKLPWGTPVRARTLQLECRQNGVLWQGPTSGYKGCNSGLTLMVDYRAAANATVAALGEGQEAAHLAGEHRFAACVVTACRRGAERLCLCLCPFPAHTPSSGFDLRSSTDSARPSPRMGSKMRSSGLASCCSR